MLLMDEPELYARKALRSSPGQLSMFTGLEHTGTAADFREDLHPRDDEGRFRPKGVAKPGQGPTVEESPTGQRKRTVKSSAGQLPLPLGDDDVAEAKRLIQQMRGEAGPRPPLAEGEKPFTLSSGKPEPVKPSGNTVQKPLFGEKPAAPMPPPPTGKAQQKPLFGEEKPATPDVAAKAPDVSPAQGDGKKPWDGRSPEDMAISPMGTHNPMWYDGHKTSGGMTMHVEAKPDGTYSAWKAFDANPELKVHVSAGKDAEMTMNNIWRGGVGVGPGTPQMEELIRKGMAKGEQKPQPQPAQKPADPEFSLSAKPKHTPAKIEGMGKAKQVDLFAGRGDSPGQTSFFDDIDPAAKNVGAMEKKSPVPATQKEAVNKSTIILGGGKVHVAATPERREMLSKVMGAKGRSEVESLIGKDAAERWYRWRIGGSEPWTSLVNAMQWQKHDTPEQAAEEERQATEAAKAERPTNESKRHAWSTEHTDRASDILAGMETNQARMREDKKVREGERLARWVKAFEGSPREVTAAKDLFRRDFEKSRQNGVSDDRLFEIIEHGQANGMFSQQEASDLKKRIKPSVAAEGQTDQPKAKEPWEMNRDEWATVKGKALANDVQKTTRDQGGVGGLDPAGLGYHYDHVAAAIAAGKPVPPEVLAEYPDLAKKPDDPLTPTERSALPETLKDVNPAFPSEVERLKGMAGGGDFQIAGMSLEEAAKLAAEHGHPDAAEKIRSRPSAWKDVLQQWRDAKKSSAAQKSRDTRAANWKPNEIQQGVLDKVGSGGRNFPRSQDMLMWGQNKAATQQLIDRGLLERTDNGREVSYRLFNPTTNAVATPQAEWNPHAELIERAKKYAEYGENYDRNIAAPLNRLLDAKAKGHSQRMLDGMAEELRMRLDAHGSKVNNPADPDIDALAKSAVAANENIWSHAKSAGHNPIKDWTPAQRKAFQEAADKHREAAQPPKPEPSEGRARAMAAQKQRDEAGTNVKHSPAMQEAIKQASEKLGIAPKPDESAEWARGVRAAKDMGGQVPQKAVNEADKILQKSGEAPMEKKVGKITVSDLEEAYSKRRPVSGDRWITPKGEYVEIGKTTKTPSGSFEVEYHFVGKNGGRTRAFYVGNPEWGDANASAGAGNATEAPAPRPLDDKIASSGGLIAKIGKQMGVKPQDMEDFISDVQLKAIQGQGGYDASKGEFSTWLGTIARNHKMTQQTRANAAKRAGVTQSLATPNESGKGSLADTVAAKETARESGDAIDLEKIRGVMGQLPDKQRQAFEAVVTGGKSVTEAAEEMGISKQAVSAYINLAKVKIKAAVGVEEDKPAESPPQPQKPAQTLAEKVAAQRAAGKKAASPKAKPKPKTMVSMSGGNYELVKQNDDGTVTVKNDQGDEFDSEPGEDFTVNGPEPSKRAWKKNEDGTYTAPNGVVWKKAAPGGEESPVNGKMFSGGQLMPIHGLHQKQPDKPNPQAGGDASAVKPNENAKKAKPAEPLAPMSPEMIESERERRERESQWQAVKSGPLGDALSLGDRPHNIKHGHGIAKKWMEQAEAMGPESVKRAGEFAKQRAIENKRQEFAKYAESLGGAGNTMIDPKWSGNAGEPYSVDQAAKEYAEDAESLIAENNPQQWGITKKHLADNPHTHSARLWVSNMLEGKNQLKDLHDLHQHIANIGKQPEAAATQSPPVSDDVPEMLPMSDDDAPESPRQEFDPANHIKIAADDIASLRRQDVYRVLDSNPAEHMDAIANYVKKSRPELASEVDSALSDIREERGATAKPEAERPAPPSATRVAAPGSTTKEQHPVLERLARSNDPTYTVTHGLGERDRWDLINHLGLADRAMKGENVLPDIMAAGKNRRSELDAEEAAATEARNQENAAAASRREASRQRLTTGLSRGTRGTLSLPTGTVTGTKVGPLFVHKSGTGYAISHQGTAGKIRELPKHADAVELAGVLAKVPGWDFTEAEKMPDSLRNTVGMAIRDHDKGDWESIEKRLSQTGSTPPEQPPGATLTGWHKDEFTGLHDAMKKQLAGQGSRRQESLARSLMESSPPAVQKELFRALKSIAPEAHAAIAAKPGIHLHKETFQ